MQTSHGMKVIHVQVDDGGIAACDLVLAKRPMYVPAFTSRLRARERVFRIQVIRAGKLQRLLVSVVARPHQGAAFHDAKAK